MLEVSKELVIAAQAVTWIPLTCRYVGKLRADLEEGALEVFSGAAERERVRSVLADLAKTASDFRAITSRALEQLASAIVPRLRRARAVHSGCGSFKNGSAVLHVDGPAAVLMPGTPGVCLRRWRSQEHFR